VEHLDLSGNQLTELPADVNRLTKLQHLNLARNKLTSLSTSLRGLGNLRRLDLTENALKDVVADLGPISHLTRLKTLYLTGNPLTNLSGLKNPALQFLSADSCGKSQPMPIIHSYAAPYCLI
jgi:Leucine-rich repeat (LRR) protein